MVRVFERLAVVDVLLRAASSDLQRALGELERAAGKDADLCEAHEVLIGTRLVVERYRELIDRRASHYEAKERG